MHAQPHAMLSRTALVLLVVLVLPAPSSSSSTCYKHPLYTWRTGLVESTAFCYTVPLDSSGGCGAYGQGSGPSAHPWDPNAFTSLEACCNDIDRYQRPLLGPGPYIRGTHSPPGCLSCAQARDSQAACKASCEELGRNPAYGKETQAACSSSCAAAASDGLQTCMDPPASLQYRAIDVFDALCKNQGLTLGDCCSYNYKQLNDICTSTDELGNQLDFYWRDTVTRAGQSYRVLDSSAHDYVFNRMLCGRCEEAM